MVSMQRTKPPVGEQPFWQELPPFLSIMEEESSILNSTMQCLGDLRELCFIKDQRRKEPLRKVKFTDLSYDAVPVSSFPSSV